MLTTEGLFREDDDFSVIMKTIENIDTTRNANQRDLQSQNESQSLPNEALDIDPGSSWSKTAQGILYSHLLA